MKMDNYALTAFQQELREREFGTEDAARLLIVSAFLRIR